MLTNPYKHVKVFQLKFTVFTLSHKLYNLIKSVLNMKYKSKSIHA